MVFDPNTLCWVADSDVHNGHESPSHYYAPPPVNERRFHSFLKSKGIAIIVYIAIFYCAWALSGFMHKHEWRTPIDLVKDIVASVLEITGINKKASIADNDNDSKDSVLNITEDITSQKRDDNRTNPYQEPCKACGALLDFSPLAHLKECDTYCPVCRTSLHITFH